ncbi:LacI family transcriptional regulator [Alginatibacterium sediminis]|uniref:LacI family transcriptional regulator n=1 Tax=Alginatibacterium sediminis TaxID=2164068 RepID=A0A420E9V5_9ALTE|nr:LacI family DNA-binding transcriptional regulator [Alginatibacterium sediminis]RKF17454.1 LacI family transcriptional regulator [Alginatibacterium sediminis]
MTDKIVTIHELAKAAGVSIASISRALNGKPGISDKLRQRIVDLSEELNYQPNTMARRLIVGNKAVVALSMPPEPHEFSERPYFVHFYQAMTLHLHTKGLVPVLFKYDQLDAIPSQACAAVLLGATIDDRPQRLRELNIPFVGLELDAEYSVTIDNQDAICKLSQYLIEQGRTKLVFLGEDNDANYSSARALGYQQAMAEAGLKSQMQHLHRESSATMNAYRHVMALAKQQGLDNDAFVCSNDEIALGVVTALKDLGIDVPTQIAVTGFDDLPKISSHLTTVHQDLTRIAESVVELLQDSIEGRNPRSVCVPTSLKFRDSA